MHRYRLTFCGSDSEVARIAGAVEAAGGLPIGPREPSAWVWAVEEGLVAVEQLAREHPMLICFEGFEDFHDELVSGRIWGGETTVECRRSVLPAHWGGFHDEDGRPLDRAVLEWAGRVIADEPRAPLPNSLYCGLATALAVSEELGRLARDTGDFLAADAPTAVDLGAIVRLAHVALSVSCAGASRSRGELAYLRPLRLTQAVAHARNDEFWETPGNAHWQSWLGTLVASASDLIDAAHHCEIAPIGADPELTPGYDPPDPNRNLELTARSTVQSCVQALALFGSTHASFAKAG